MPGDKGFGHFLLAKHGALVRISRATRGESSIEDVKGEAYVLGAQLAALRRHELDFAEPQFQEDLLARLYQHLVRYTEKNVRHATRLDHAPPGRDGADSRPRIENLAAPDPDPLELLMNEEDAAASTGEVNPHESAASAYVVLLRRFGNRMASLARYLLISESYAYRRVATARIVRTRQACVATSLKDDFLPRPWRRFRCYRRPVQMELDFGENPALEFPDAPVAHDLRERVFA